MTHVLLVVVAPSLRLFCPGTCCKTPTLNVRMEIPSISHLGPRTWIKTTLQGTNISRSSRHFWKKMNFRTSRLMGPMFSRSLEGNLQVAARMYQKWLVILEFVVQFERWRHPVSGKTEKQNSLEFFHFPLFKHKLEGVSNWEIPRAFFRPLGFHTGNQPPAVHLSKVAILHWKQQGHAGLQIPRVEKGPEPQLDLNR